MEGKLSKFNGKLLFKIIFSFLSFIENPSMMTAGAAAMFDARSRRHSCALPPPPPGAFPAPVVSVGATSPAVPPLFAKIVEF
jgi:hypothetical protein